MNQRELKLYSEIASGLAPILVRVAWTDAGWVVELIEDSDGGMEDVILLQEVAYIIKRTFGSEEFIWKIFIYRNPNARFLANGTLHTQPFSYSNSGIFSTVLTAEDCFLDFTEFDAEILQLQPSAGRVLVAKESLDDNTPILPFKTSSSYIWLEALGGHYMIDPSSAEINQGIVSFTLA